MWDKVSTIIRALTSKDGDLLSHSDKNDESEAESENKTVEHHLINNLDPTANKSKIEGRLPLEHIFGFSSAFKRKTKHLGFHLTFKTADLQDIFYTTLGGDIKVNFANLSLCVPIIIFDAQTQIMFNDSNKKSFTLSFSSWSTARKTVDTHLDYQVDIGSAQKTNSPKYLVVAHQTGDRIQAPNKSRKTAVFHSLNVRNFHVDIDAIRYPRERISNDFA